MNEEAKIILYKQLVIFEEKAKLKNGKLISWENYCKLTDKEALEYASDFRDKCSEIFNKKARKNERRPFYLELPDMDFEGKDLSDFYLHDFMPGYAKERNNGKKVFITTNINLKDTKCVINMGTIRPIILSFDGRTIREISADVKKCDFRGCLAFGKFQNSRAKLEYTEENLPQEYIDRLVNYKVPDEAVITTDNIYLNMLDGKIVRGTNGIEKVKQMVDYNLVDLNEGIWKYRTVIRDFNIDISYTGVFLYQYGFESIGKENYYINLEKRARDAYLKGDMDFVEKVFKDLDKETKRSLVGLALKDRKRKLCKKASKGAYWNSKEIFYN